MKLRERLRDGQIDVAGIAENLDRRQQRKENEQQIDIDGMQRRRRPNTAAREKRRGENSGEKRQPVTPREREHESV